MPLASHVLYEARSTLSGIEVQEMEAIPYRETMRSLLYLSSITRSDIAVSVSMLGNFVSQLAARHWKTIKQLVRYLIATADFGLHIRKHSETVPVALSDADWGRDGTSDARGLEFWLLLVVLL